jgi:hypothetical protein
MKIDLNNETVKEWVGKSEVVVSKFDKRDDNFKVIVKEDRPLPMGPRYSLYRFFCLFGNKVECSVDNKSQSAEEMIKYLVDPWACSATHLKV